MERKFKFISSLMVICMSFALICGMIPASLAQEVEQTENKENAEKAELMSENYAVQDGIYEIINKNTSKRLGYKNNSICADISTSDNPKAYIWKITFAKDENGAWYTIRSVSSPNYVLTYDLFDGFSLQYLPEGQSLQGGDSWMFNLLSNNTFEIKNSYYRNQAEKYPFLTLDPITRAPVMRFTNTSDGQWTLHELSPSYK